MTEFSSRAAPHIVTSYLESQSRSHQTKIDRLANEFAIPGRPLAATVAAIPVAAHQESPNILRAMSQYAHQRTDEPFSVLLYPNHPPRAPKKEVHKTIDAIEQAKDMYPQLDLRSTRPDSLKKSYTIGSIRKNLWDAALVLAVQDGSFGKYGDIIGMNHDIDPVSISRNYVARVQKRVFGDLQKSGLHLPPYGTHVRHALDKTHKNTSKVVFWYDLACRNAGPTGSYSAGFVTTFSRYARRNGFNDKQNNHETKQLIGHDVIEMIPGTNISTSMRRFQNRLQSYPLEDVWTEDSFTSTDRCRTFQLPDIHEDRARELIDNSLDTVIPRFFRNLIKGPSWEFPSLRKEFQREIAIKKNVAIHALRHVIAFPEIADKVDRSYSIANMEGYVFQYALRQRRH